MVAYFVDLTAALGNGPTAFTGSQFPQGNSNSVAVTQALIPNTSISTGSWPGLGNTWGASNLLTGTLVAPNSLTEGHWWGIDISWGTYQIPTESIDRTDVTSNLNPFPDQGLAEGDWDPFPIPILPPVPVLPPRDLTRYRKAYSAQRHQPIRIRLVKS